MEGNLSVEKGFVRENDGEMPYRGFSKHIVTNIFCRENVFLYTVFPHLFFTHYLFQAVKMTRFFFSFSSKSSVPPVFTLAEYQNKQMNNFRRH